MDVNESAKAPKVEEKKIEPNYPPKTLNGHVLEDLSTIKELFKKDCNIVHLLSQPPRLDYKTADNNPGAACVQKIQDALFKFDLDPAQWQTLRQSFVAKDMANIIGTFASIIQAKLIFQLTPHWVRHLVLLDWKKSRSLPEKGSEDGDLAVITAMVVNAEDPSQ